jgi:phosphate-selective porin OprO/OprP
MSPALCFIPLPERRIDDPLIVVANRLIVRKRARFHRSSQRLSACLLSAIALASISAAEPGALEPAPSIYDKIWRYAEWYNDKDNPLIQSFRFTGRFQLDYALVEADQGNHDEWNIRRFRLGGDAKLFREFTLHSEVDLNPQEPHPVYQRLTDMYVAWSRSQDFRITMGKHSAPFTMDGSTSSRELVAIDRSNLANNLWFPQEYIPGISVSGRPGQWRYWAGVYSSGAANKEFGEFNGGAFLLTMVGYDFGKILHVKQAVLAGNYVYNEPDVNNTFTRSLHQIGSLNFSLDTGKWGLRTDLAAGSGYLGQSDLWGAMLMPFYSITDHFQLVARYTYLKGEHPNSVRLAAYENIVVPGRGDEYNEFYLGLNYYFYGHKLKLQTGVQYAQMRDQAGDGGAYRGWAWTTGLRISW